MADEALRTVQDAPAAEWWLLLPMVRPLTMNDAPTMSKRARMQRNAQVRQLREDVYWLAKQKRLPPCEYVRVTLVYEPPGLNRAGKRMNPRRDPMNLNATLKPVQDGLVDAGVVPDDTSRYMESPQPIIDAPLNSQHGRVWIYVERLR